MIATVDIPSQLHRQSLNAYSEAAPVELTPNALAQEQDVVIQAVYRQVMGNAHIMESERLVEAESQLRNGTSSVREFVRQVAQSELYRRRFFDNCYRYRSIELNFKHLLGRAPQSFEELKYHSHLLDTQGFEADIDSYIDSDEYQAAFGEFFVPYYRGHLTQPGHALSGYNHILTLFRSASTSDNSLTHDNAPQVATALLRPQPPGILRASDAQDVIAKALGLQSSTLGSQSQQSQGQPPQLQLSQAQAELKAKRDEQTAVIAQLRQQLADLRPLASVGTAMTRSFAVASVTISESQAVLPTVQGPTVQGTSALHQQVNEQAATIEQLQREIASARPLATLANAKLNRWRQRYGR